VIKLADSTIFYRFDHAKIFATQMLTRDLFAVANRNGVRTNFGVKVGQARPEGPRAGDGVLGEGQPAPAR